MSFDYNKAFTVPDDGLVLENGVHIISGTASPQGLINPSNPTLYYRTQSEVWYHDGVSGINGWILHIINSTLTGFIAGSNNVITASDTILQAIQKSQGQINARALANRIINTTGGLQGGGDLSADRNLSIIDTGVGAGTYGLGYGSTFTVNSKGQLTAVVQGKGRYISRMTSSQTSSSTTPANLTGLTSVYLPIGNYYVRALIRIQSAVATNGYGLRLNVGTAVVSNPLVSWQLPTNADFSTAHFNSYAQRALTDNNITGTIGAANTDYLVVANGIFTVTTAGTVNVQLRSEANGTVVTAGIGSCLIIEEL